MRLDLHNHTRYSPDSRVDPRDLVATAKRLGLDGIAVTDHNSVGGVRLAEEAAKLDFLVIPGTEVSSREGHILAYGVQEQIPRGLSVLDTIDRVVALGGIPVAAHPYRFWSGIGQSGIVSAPFRAYETRNARTLRRANLRAMRLARARRVAETGGSDSHYLDEVARATTDIDGGVLDVDGVLQALEQGKTRPEGVDRGGAATLRYVTKCVGEWIARGMRRI